MGIKMKNKKQKKQKQEETFQAELKRLLQKYSVKLVPIIVLDAEKGISASIDLRNQNGIN